MCSTDIFLGVLAVLFPPLPVWVKCGICSADSIINILLCMLGYLPGLLHAWYIIARYPDPFYGYEELPTDAGESRVRYVFVRDDGSHCPHPQHHQHQPQQQHHHHYQQPTSPLQAQYQEQQQPQSQPQPQPQPQEYGTVQAGPSDGSAPPSYTEAVGDHKVQSQD